MAACYSAETLEFSLGETNQGLEKGAQSPCHGSVDSKPTPHRVQKQPYISVCCAAETVDCLAPGCSDQEVESSDQATGPVLVNPTPTPLRKISMLDQADTLTNGSESRDAVRTKTDRAVSEDFSVPSKPHTMLRRVSRVHAIMNDCVSEQESGGNSPASKVLRAVDGRSGPAHGCAEGLLLQGTEMGKKDETPDFSGCIPHTLLRRVSRFHIITNPAELEQEPSECDQEHDDNGSEPEQNDTPPSRGGNPETAHPRDSRLGGASDTHFRIGYSSDASSANASYQESDTNDHAHENRVDRPSGLVPQQTPRRVSRPHGITDAQFHICCSSDTSSANVSFQKPDINDEASENDVQSRGPCDLEPRQTLDRAPRLDTANNARFHIGCSSDTSYANLSCQGPEMDEASENHVQSHEHGGLEPLRRVSRPDVNPALKCVKVFDSSYGEFNINYEAPGGLEPRRQTLRRVSRLDGNPSLNLVAESGTRFHNEGLQCSSTGVDLDQDPVSSSHSKHSVRAQENGMTENVRMTGSDTTDHAHYARIAQSNGHDSSHTGYLPRSATRQRSGSREITSVDTTPGGDNDLTYRVFAPRTRQLTAVFYISGSEEETNSLSVHLPDCSETKSTAVIFNLYSSPTEASSFQNGDQATLSLSDCPPRHNENKNDLKTATCNLYSSQQSTSRQNGEQNDGDATSQICTFYISDSEAKPDLVLENGPRRRRQKKKPKGAIFNLYSESSEGSTRTSLENRREMSEVFEGRRHRLANRVFCISDSSDEETTTVFQTVRSLKKGKISFYISDSDEETATSQNGRSRKNGHRNARTIHEDHISTKSGLCEGIVHSSSCSASQNGMILHTTGAIPKTVPENRPTSSRGFPESRSGRQQRLPPHLVTREKWTQLLEARGVIPLDIRRQTAHASISSGDHTSSSTGLLGPSFDVSSESIIPRPWEMYPQPMWAPPPTLLLTHGDGVLSVLAGNIGLQVDAMSLDLPGLKNFMREIDDNINPACITTSTPKKGRSVTTLCSKALIPPAETT